VHAGVYMLPETLETNLRTLAERRDCDELSSVDDVWKYFRRFVEVLTF